MFFGWQDEGYGPTTLWWQDSGQEQGISANYKWVNSHYIDQIVFRGGRVQFEYEEYDADRTRILNPALKRIVVYDAQDNVRRTIVFTQTGIGQDYERYLQSMKIGNDTYSFDYHHNRHVGECFPDFWGMKPTAIIQRICLMCRHMKCGFYPEPIRRTYREID